MMRARCMLLLFLGAGLAAAAAPDGVLPFASDSSGFVQALTPYDFQFPRDHGAHPAFAHEWWYVTGHLAATTGERFGFELTMFRIALAPPALAAPAQGSAWRARQMYVVHFAVTDIDHGRFRFQERFARAALGLAGAQSHPLKVWVDDWSLGFADGAWQIRAAAQGYALDVRMTTDLPPILNGDRGLSQKSGDPRDASYYYSIPRLSVRGELARDGKTFPVAGSAWLDREWGSGGLGADESGWDWFALQLSDGSELMFYSLRRRDGRRDPHSAGTWVEPDGSARALATDDVAISVQEYWTSPRGGRYPARWQVEVPSLGIAANLRPVLPDQELDGRPRYWEGAVDVTGTQSGRNLKGQGYVELVGYARAP
jgi:predicted secreted hydrolase